MRNAILATIAALALSTGPVLAGGGGGAPQSLINSSQASPTQAVSVARATPSFRNGKRSTTRLLGNRTAVAKGAGNG